MSARRRRSGIVLGGSFALGVLLLAPVASRAQEPGSYGSVVLRLAPAPRADALGGAYAASAADPFAVRFNPAAAAAVPVGGAVAFRAHPGDVALGAAAAALSIGPFGAAVSLLYLDLGQVREMVPDPSVGGQRGTPTGATVGGGEVALGVALGGRLGPLELGAGATVLRSWLAEAADAGLALDAGARGTLLGGRLALGAAVLGLGPSSGPGRAADLPRRIRAGGEMRLGAERGLGARISGGVGGSVDVLRPGGGFELRLPTTEGSALLLRAGYDGEARPEDALSPWSVGGGVEITGWAVDYAYRGMGALGEAHIVGVRWRRTVKGG